MGLKNKLRRPHLYLRDVGEANDERDEADNEDEDLLPLPQLQGVLVHQSGDEAFHRAELRRRGTKRRERGCNFGIDSTSRCLTVYYFKLMDRNQCGTNRDCLHVVFILSFLPYMPGSLQLSKCIGTIAILKF